MSTRNLGPRKTIYWKPEWEEADLVWDFARFLAIRKGSSISRLIYELLRKKMQVEQKRQSIAGRDK